jgi:hypothetical protein
VRVRKSRNSLASYVYSGISNARHCWWMGRNTPQQLVRCMEKSMSRGKNKKKKRVSQYVLLTRPMAFKVQDIAVEAQKHGQPAIGELPEADGELGRRWTC